MHGVCTFNVRVFLERSKQGIEFKVLEFKDSELKEVSTWRGESEKGICSFSAVYKQHLFRFYIDEDLISVTSLLAPHEKSIVGDQDFPKEENAPLKPAAHCDNLVVFISNVRTCVVDLDRVLSVAAEKDSTRSCVRANLMHDMHMGLVQFE